MEEEESTKMGEKGEIAGREFRLRKERAGGGNGAGEGESDGDGETM